MIAAVLLASSGLASTGWTQDAPAPTQTNPLSPIAQTSLTSPGSLIDSAEPGSAPLASGESSDKAAALPAPEPDSASKDPAAMAAAAGAPAAATLDRAPTASITGTEQAVPAGAPRFPADAASNNDIPATNNTPQLDATQPGNHLSTATTRSALLQGALEQLVFADIKGPRASEEQKTRVALAAFYTLRNFAPLWTDGGQVTAAARSVMDRLQHAQDDGLNLISTPDLLAGSDEERIKADIALSEAVTVYARTASGSRIDPKSISPLIGEKPEVADAFDVLTAVSNGGEKSGDILWAYNPPQKGYQDLRGKLAELRHENAPVANQRIPSGPDLSVGMRDPRVSLIRARFGLDGQPADATGHLIYDTRVAAAVADFQKSKGLPVSGILTARTIAALSGGQPSRLENEILANMERWRWMPRDMGETYIAVNIPDFTVSVVHGDQVLTKHRVVVGKPDTPTPVFSNKMQYLIVNPYWNVPQSIIRKEFMPKYGGDLSALSEHGWTVSSQHGLVSVRQPPGEKNALGRIKFLFPNDYSVYLHDTPSRALFASQKRAFSHGCVRVDEPFSFAETVLGHSWSEQRLKALIGDKERYINLPIALPIHIEYFTTYVDEFGRLQLRDDLYGYSHKVKVALGLEN